MSRYDELKWEYNDIYKEWRLYGQLYSWQKGSFLFARLKETTTKNEYVWTLADFKDETEAQDINGYNAIGFEDFETIDEAKSKVICELGDNVESAIADLEEIAELFS